MKERIDYLVIESGYYTDFMGYSGVNILAKNAWVSGQANVITEVPLLNNTDSNIITNTPLVLHQPKTTNGTDPYISRIFNVDKERLEVVLQKEAANRDTNPGQPDEKIGLLAIDAGTQSSYKKAAFIAEEAINVSHSWNTLDLGSVFALHQDGDKVVLMSTQTMAHDLREFPAGNLRGRNLNGSS